MAISLRRAPAGLGAIGMVAVLAALFVCDSFAYVMNGDHRALALKGGCALGRREASWGIIGGSWVRVPQPRA
ncbi:MAG TPA: hypothetical protein VES19_01130 [Candidatus Limnocylindrales bacterium]|nr:hypothetical protein [Candidatus Limnocylindrales bacterium]